MDRKNCRTADYVSLDLETTGLNPKLDKIIEIGAVRVRSGKVTERFSAFVNPGIKINEYVTTLTGITQNQVDSAPAIGELLPKLMNFLGEDVLVGHRILFDYSFVKKAAVTAGIPFERQGIDTLKLARACLINLPKKTLGSVCGYYNIPLKAHRAYSDAEATAAVLERLYEEYGETYPELFVPKPLLYKAKKEAKATVAQREQIERLVKQYEIDFDADLSMLSRSEASRWISQILQAYAR